MTQKKYPQVKKIGLLATTGTIHTRLFQDLFKHNGVEILVPDRENQDLVMKALYQEEGIKAGFKEYPRQMVLQVLHHLVRQQVEAVIAGCTEIPLVLTQADLEVPFIDPLCILAEKSLHLANPGR